MLKVKFFRQGSLFTIDSEIMRRFGNAQEIKTEVTRLIEDRLSLISVDREKYEIEEATNGKGETITVRYNGSSLMTIRPFISNFVENGRRMVRGAISIKAVFDDYWYNNYDLNENIFVDEYMRCQLGNESTTFDNLLNILLPLADEEKTKRIYSELETMGWKEATVKFDTYTYKYVVEGDIRSFLDDGEEKSSADVAKKRYYKYMSFNTFIEILKSKKMRLNSIMSMNDSSETFYLGDYLCKAYEDERRTVLHPKSKYFGDEGLRNSKVVEYKNMLIGCFSEKADDALMWRLYGDGGRDENNQKARQLMELVRMLKNEGISLYYKDLANYQFYTKSHNYRDEGEWRIMKEAGNGELKFASYGGLVTFYRDYDFEELGLKPVAVWLGANLAYKDVNVPLLTDLSKRELGVVYVKKSRVESLRV